MDHNNNASNQNISNNKIEYKHNVPSEKGFVFKFVKKDNNFIHTFSEGSFLKKLGLSSSSFVGKPLSDFFSGDQLNAAFYCYETAWNGNIISFEGSTNGFSYLTTLTPITINSQVVEVIGTVFEITEFRKNALKIQELEKLSLIGELAAGVAHEIRNPLTSITGFAQLIEELSNDETINIYLEVMLTELNRINTIVNEFMFISKPKENMDTRDTDIKVLISHVIKFMSPQATLRGVRLSESISSNSTLIAHCDPNQIIQVLMNLVQNAIEATTDPAQEIVISLKNTNKNSLLIEVTDKGSGISKERLKRLFEPFYTTKEKGTGLGLMMCRRIIENHNGTIKINSQLGEGTTVRITLPKSFNHQKQD
ncbi:ATP-binding protein [Domibacillus sp. DTU_2020_1001157_1_SI_ALB_TIR_016]|uniref:ATP-binding protein n=1 Tax=Domibacillus sp. DTU_2020_1001157_1_SI_ALB_TIR_016 TaxID=3077789 RepID=UPI0028E93F50|nr:ATP-binding protein [Domibacillus sp. DTU_2020_1001157_1_SI_ALB_TIR_016]WNS79616.1 ATP-binding protein [Domibacillus sp. DTU_2020_1001157_1_SI_ALB_TIR_016]